MSTNKVVALNAAYAPVIHWPELRNASHSRLAGGPVATKDADGRSLWAIAVIATAAPATNSIMSGVTLKRIAAAPAIQVHATGTTDAVIGTRGTAVRSTPHVNSVVGQGTANSGARGYS